MSVFPLLKDVASYRPCQTDLIADAAARAYWIGQFRALMPIVRDAARSIGVDESSIAAAANAFGAELNAFEQRPDRCGRLDILLLDEIRQEILFRHGIVNEFGQVKQRENDATLPLLGEWLSRLDALDEPARLERLVHGMLAGNLFDMGAEHTAKEFAGGVVSFETALARVPDRPWFRDDVEALTTRWMQRPWRKAVLLADNAGADATLGLLPMARELLRSGVEVVITANEKPTWNDITVVELSALLERAAAIDACFTSRYLTLISNGTFTPLIDLRRISAALADAAAGAELMVLIGMGRGVESNWRARFTCECLRVAMLKDPHTANSVGGRLFDAVARFDRPS